MTLENESTPLPPGPAAAAAEAAARGRATDEVPDLQVSRAAILRRALPVVAVFAAAGVIVGVLRRRLTASVI